MAKKEVNTDLWVYDLLKEAKINDKFTVNFNSFRIHGFLLIIKEI